MSSSAELHLLYKVANAPFNWFPYPHFFVEEVFPKDFYLELQANIPDSRAMLPIEQVRGVKGYDERFVLDFGPEQLATLTPAQRTFWQSFHSWLVAGRLGELVVSKFGRYIDERFKDKEVYFRDEALLIQDITNYALGPHSDSPRKVVSFLFYLPRDDSQRHLGTSMYVPKDAAFRCQGGPHYKHDSFDRVATMPFVPNSLFAFFKNDMSFHGVERVEDPDCRRWLLLYDMYLYDNPAVPKPAPSVPSAVKFSF